MKNKHDVVLNIDTSIFPMFELFYIDKSLSIRFRSCSVLRKISSPFNSVNGHQESHNTVSSTPTLNLDEQVNQLQSTYFVMMNHLEDEHLRNVSLLQAEWEQVVKECIRLQRLTLDYKQEQQQLIKENQQWKALCDECVQERLQIQCVDKANVHETTKTSYLNSIDSY